MKLNIPHKSWEELTKKEKDKWNKLVEKSAKEHEGLLRFLIWASKSKKCFMCKMKFKNGLLNKNPYKVVPLLEMLSGEFLFHLKSTHGIPPEIFRTMLLKLKK